MPEIKNIGLSEVNRIIRDVRERVGMRENAVLERLWGSFSDFRDCVRSMSELGFERADDLCGGLYVIAMNRWDFNEEY
jgi:hypothetical protein